MILIFVVMFQICKFDSKTDICRTVPGLSTDLKQAIYNGVVLDTGTDGAYNEVDDPARIRGRVRDAFQAVDLQRSVLAAGKILPNPESSSSPSTPSGASE